MNFYSPLRYPGGKNKISNFVKDILLENQLYGCEYMEPFAGGACVGLSLLFAELVSKIHINDIDRSIYAFWYSVLYETDYFCKLVWDTPVTIDEWDKQKKIQDNKTNESYIDLGFSTFFLNRSNRSGILNGGMIGGRSQAGRWKIDARYNKKNLVDRINKIALFQNRINLYNLDAKEFVTIANSQIGENNKSFIYFDPPYYEKGDALYTNSFKHVDHQVLADFIHSLDSDWILTYDYVDPIIEMYKKNKKRKLYLNYTAAKKRKGTEVLFASNKLKIPDGFYSSIKVMDF